MAEVSKVAEVADEVPARPVRRADRATAIVGKCPVSRADSAIEVAS
ncbi:MAG: hypothetical protein KDC57_04885 [Saprospiraceae bacterium]|nr:hypothetical protein [Saprospiraceae bacterium]